MFEIIIAAVDVVVVQNTFDIFVNKTEKAGKTSFVVWIFFCLGLKLKLPLMSMGYRLFLPLSNLFQCLRYA